MLPVVPASLVVGGDATLVVVGESIKNKMQSNFGKSKSTLKLVKCIVIYQDVLSAYES